MFLLPRKAYIDCSKKKLLGLDELAIVKAERSLIIQTDRGIGVRGSKYLLANLKRSSQERLALSVFALSKQRFPDAVQARGRFEGIGH